MKSNAETVFCIKTRINIFFLFPNTTFKADAMNTHPCSVVTNLMKLSFDDDHRQAMSHLGALHGLSELLHLDQLAHGSLCNEAQCTTLRRYASMTLTNLTFGHGPNKTLLCSIRPLLVVLSRQLASPNDDLRQVRRYQSDGWVDGWMIKYINK